MSFLLATFAVWDFAWEKGSFEVEFQCDGFNHFVCKSFPAHSHWQSQDDVVRISWGQYGRDPPAPAASPL